MAIRRVVLAACLLCLVACSLVLSGCTRASPTASTPESSRAATTAPAGYAPTIVTADPQSRESKRALSTAKLLFGPALSRVIFTPNIESKDKTLGLMSVELVRNGDWGRQCFGLMKEIMALSPHATEYWVAVYYPTDDGTGRMIGLSYRPQKQALESSTATTKRPTGEGMVDLKRGASLRASRREVAAIALGGRPIPWATW